MTRLHSKRQCLLAGGIALTAALAACGGNPAPKASTPPSAAPSSSAPAGSGPATTPAAADVSSSMSGTWSGQYGGAYQGTFKLTWQQKGSRLSGSITLSNPGGTLPIHGRVNGSAISFGTVGGQAITYTGSVSGTSMSGSYRVVAPGGSAGGTWSATKSG
ncbi:MAG TPA: hypothetical protein VKS82_21205 [Streptosporangiaceae bacterium]|nr:hypothetical protein [Streptosporangiaceae bacterium]